ncbi:MAG: hypothetical protein MJH10_10040 [Epibacterium sp.]|nr:hypothetical protein [Epibacterium sp.]NQX73877.1 hypothetical protein [Epibacterium sp.]
MALPDLVVNVTAKFDDFRAAMANVRADLDKTSTTVGNTKAAFVSSAAAIRKLAAPVAAVTAALGAASAAGFGLASSTAKAGDSAAKTADRLGIGIEALQELRFAAERSGVSANQFDTALQRMTRRIAEAAQGSGAAKDAIEELGLDAAALATMTPDAALEAVADSMAHVADQSDRVRLGFKLFDSEGVGLINTLAGGADGLEEMRQAARDTGAVISEDTARASEQFQDRMQDLQSSMAGLRTEIGEKLIPIFVDVVIPVLVDKVIPAIASVIEALSKVGPAISTMRENVTGAINGIRNTFNEWVTWFQELPARFVQFGEDVITGFQQGITTKFNEIKDSLMSPFQNFTAGVRGIFRTQSPSKVFREIGGWVSEGFALGVQGGADQIRESAGVFDEFTQKAQSALAKNRKIAAAEAFINAAKAASQALASPGLNPFAKIAAAASVFSAGKQFVQAINSGSASAISGGAGGAAPVSAAPAQSQAPLQVSLAGLNADQLYEGGGIGRLFDYLNKEARDRGFPGYMILGA